MPKLTAVQVRKARLKKACKLPDDFGRYLHHADFTDSLEEKIQHLKSNISVQHNPKIQTGSAAQVYL